MLQINTGPIDEALVEEFQDYQSWYQRLFYEQLANVLRGDTGLETPLRVERRKMQFVEVLALLLDESDSDNLDHQLPRSQSGMPAEELFGRAFGLQGVGTYGQAARAVMAYLAMRELRQGPDKSNDNGQGPLRVVA